MALFKNKISDFVTENDNVYFPVNEINAIEINSISDIRRVMLQIVRMIMDSGRGIYIDNLSTDLLASKKQLRKQALNIIKNSNISLDNDTKIKVLEEFDKYMWGYYILDDLINDPEVSDIKVLSYNFIRYKKYGRRYVYQDSFIDENDYSQYVNLIAVRNKKNISDINAICNFTDNSCQDVILRFNICTQYVTSNRIPILTIRKILRDKYTIKRLIEKEMLDNNLANFLIDKVINSKGILFTGKGASGKTTLLNALIEYIEVDKSILVIQENDELFSDTQNKVNRDISFLHTVNSSAEGKIEYTLSDLARNGLLMDIDYYIIGEIKGDEALGFSMASYTGHKCLATVHGMNSYEGINKLADYIKGATNYSFSDCLKKLIGIEYVVYLSDFKVCEITQICGYDNVKEDLIKKVVFKENCWL